MTTGAGQANSLNDAFISTDFGNGRKQVGGNRRFRDVPSRTGSEGLPSHFRALVLGNNQDFGIGKKALDLFGSFQPVQTRHAEVHHDNVRAKLPSLIDTLLAVYSFAANG